MAAYRNEYRDLFLGLDCRTPLFGGGSRTYVNLDNAATTPAFRQVAERVMRGQEWYASIHRGAGFKSLLSTHAFDRARKQVAAFFGANSEKHALVFCANATDAINRLCGRFHFQPDDVVLTSVLEHHSNLLPWRLHGNVHHINARWPCGILDMDDFATRLHENAGHVRLVALTGASNITGLLPPIREIARMTHEHGALFLMDASQLAAHRSIDVGPPGEPESIDFLVFSGHKMYAPFGSGGLIGPRDFFAAGPPTITGGGAVSLVTLDDVEWAEAPERDEAGTPNLPGVLALETALKILGDIGMERVAEHERELTRHAFDRLGAIDGLHIYGGCEKVNETDRLGVLPFVFEGYHHAHLAAILGYEWGIGVRNGCFCAHPYVEHLLAIAEPEIRRHFESIRQGRHSELPGFVRASFGLYNTRDEIDCLAEALGAIRRKGPRAEYAVNPRTGEYAPEGYAVDFEPLIW